METNTTNESPALINPRAGLTRGVRIWPDPDSILESTFEESGQKMGYVFVYGEDEPAVFDGTNWHPILTGEVKWEDMQERIVTQYYKIVEHAEKNEAYRDLAAHVTGTAARV